MSYYTKCPHGYLVRTVEVHQPGDDVFSIGSMWYRDECGSDCPFQNWQSSSYDKHEVPESALAPQPPVSIKTPG